MSQNASAHRLLRYFAYDHLPEALKPTSQRFYDLAHKIVDDPDVTDPAEQTVALRKLLEAKDAAVRAKLSVRR